MNPIIQTHTQTHRSVRREEMRHSRTPSPPPPPPPLDLISTLPQDIIHHILSLLPDFSAVLETGLVSKRFASLARSCPFVIVPYKQWKSESWWSSFLDSASRMVIMRYNKNEHVPLHEFIFKVCLYSERDDRLDSILQHAFTNCVGKVHIDIHLFFSKGDSTYLWRAPESAPPFVFRALQLYHVALDLQALILGSPFLEDLKLSDCVVLGKNVRVSSPTLKTLDLRGSRSEKGGTLLLVVEAPNLNALYGDPASIDFSSCKRLQKLMLTSRPASNNFNCGMYAGQISKLPSLETLNLSFQLKDSEVLIISSFSLKRLDFRAYNKVVRAVRVAAPNLESLALNIKGCKFLDITPSKHLRRMFLQQACIDASWFEEHLSDFPLLQRLHIRCDNKHLTRINISHAGLLEFSFFIMGIEDLKMSINAPRLLCFNCYLDEFHNLPVITNLIGSPSLKVELSCLHGINHKLDYSYRERADKSWKWWQLLQGLSDFQFQCIKFPFDCCHEDLAFLHNRRFGLLLPYFKIELRIKRSLIEKSILLFCHPKTMTFIFFGYASMIKFHYEEGTLEAKGSSCCKSHSVACWRYCLKGVTLFNFEGKQSSLRNFFIRNAKISNACIRQVFV